MKSGIEFFKGALVVAVGVAVGMIAYEQAKKLASKTA